MQERHLRTTGAGLEVVARRPTAFLEYWLAFLVSPVARGLFEGGVQDGVVDEHGYCP